MKKLITNFMLIGVLLICMISSVKGQLYNTQPFDTPPPLWPTQLAGFWYPDRYQPAAFDMATIYGGNRLHIGISVNDGAQLRPGAYSSQFYNTQGRKYDLANDVTDLYGSLYIPADWASKHRRTDIWATAFNHTDLVNPTDYPIIGFANTTGSRSEEHTSELQSL